jgi:hypothetical protein
MSRHWEWGALVCLYLLIGTLPVTGLPQPASRNRCN